MFKQVKKYPNSPDYIINNNDVILLSPSKESIFIKNQDKILATLPIEEHAGNIFLIHDFLVWQDMFGRTKIWDKKNMDLVFEELDIEKELHIKPFEFTDNEIILCTLQESDSKKHKILNLRTFREEQLDGLAFIILIKDDRIIHKKRNRNIICHNIEGEKQWDISISGSFTLSDGNLKDIELAHLLGTTDNTLWLKLNSFEIWGINIETGEIIHQIPQNNLVLDGIHIEKGIFLNLPVGTKHQLIPERGQIVGLDGTHFSSMDITQNEVTRNYFTIERTLNRFQGTASFRYTAFPYWNQYLFFCDDQQAKLGVFDMDTHEVVWSHQLDIPKEGIAQILEMQYADPYWYVLDRYNTLHIFEREC